MEKEVRDLQVAYKEDEIKHLKEMYMAKMSQVSPEVLATMNSSEGSRDTRPRTRVHELCTPGGPGSSADNTVCSQPEKQDTRHL